ncbi:hypothetical protein BDW02DRAFT_563749 [Decorospora gaudefroyi]|uniref:Uncharacterized protein n=1 Tax=Decorospora gaudefroyi TaxID=184978 RepID=A0A6A5KXZ9_9PLEO|nr:hypothetical protein BDW02DRAFT_563749 [Decorospora gaudefroyi]
MCTVVTLKHSTCQHRHWIRRTCHRHPHCILVTEVSRERGGECWECDPGQGPPEALFPREVSWRRVKVKVRESAAVSV